MESSWRKMGRINKSVPLASSRQHYKANLKCISQFGRYRSKTVDREKNRIKIAKYTHRVINALQRHFLSSRLFSHSFCGGKKQKKKTLKL